MPGSDDEDVLGGDVSMDEDVSMEEDDDGDAADDEDEHDGADVAGTRRGSAQKKHRRPREVMPLFGVKRSKASKRGDVKHPEKNAAERAQVYARRFSKALDLRADIKISVLCRVILSLSPEERAELRQCPAMQQEWYLAQRDCVTRLEKQCFNALNAIDLRACEAMPVRMMQRIADRLSCDESGKRILICRPPTYKGAFNPLTQKSNREQGIKWEDKAVLAPRVFPAHAAIVAAGERVLEGQKLHLAHDFDGAAWCFLDLADDILSQLERDANMLVLPPSVMRAPQLIFDGHGFLSRSSYRGQVKDLTNQFSEYFPRRTVSLSPLTSHHHN